MKLASLLGHLIELHRDSFALTTPLDQMLQEFFAARRYLGKRDRMWLSDQFWPLQRGRLRWEALAAHAEAAPGLPIWMLHPWIAAHTPDSALTAAFAADVTAPALEDWPELFAQAAHGVMDEGDDEAEKLLASLQWWLRWCGESMARILAEADPLSTLRTGWPAWLSAALITRLESLDAPVAPLEHIHAFQQSAALALRANTLRTTRRERMQAIEAAEMSPLESALAPDAILLKRRARIQQLPLARNGTLEVQDEGSQLVSLALDPQPGWRVLDACAGGGGKALHLAALMQNQGVIYASDLSAKRIAPLPERARRAGAQIIRIEYPANAAALHNLDAVLIDAPCTGLGTLRRHPDLLWRTSPEEAQNRADQQLALLKRYAPCLRHGGLLVYATCSFLVEESDAVIAAFLAEHPHFRPEPVLPRWQAYFATRRFETSPMLRHGATALGHQLLPAFHGCDAFFVSVLCHTSA